MTTSCDSLVLLGEMSVLSGVTPSFLRKLAERGAVPAIRPGRYWAFRVCDVGAIREAATAAGRPPLTAAATSQA